MKQFKNVEGINSFHGGGRGFTLHLLLSTCISLPMYFIGFHKFKGEGAK
jgi:hypothetical protein